jgi:Rod binding domain-containing protein
MNIEPVNTSEQIATTAVVDPLGLSRVSSIKDPQARAEAVAGQLESVFFGMMIKAMRATVPDAGLLGKGLGGRNYVEMLDQQLAQMASLPRDPRFHEALVRQIMQSPEEAGQALAKMSRPEPSAAGMQALEETSNGQVSL